MASTSSLVALTAGPWWLSWRRARRTIRRSQHRRQGLQQPSRSEVHSPSGRRMQPVLATQARVRRNDSGPSASAVGAKPTGGIEMRHRVAIGRQCIGFGLMVSLAWLGPGLRAEEARRDWSRVQALPSGQQIVVKPFKGMGPKVKGAYVSSDAGHLVVRRQHGQAVTIPKDRIRLVARKRRIRLLHAIGIGAAAGFAVMAIWTLGEGDFDQPRGALFVGGVGAALGTLGGFAVRAMGMDSIVYQAENQDVGPSKNP